MSKKYTVTVYIAAPGTPLTEIDGAPKMKQGKQEHSLVGHVYYKISNGTKDGTKGYGFAPKKDGDPFGLGDLKDDEYLKYKGPVYERQLEISEAQYKKLLEYGKDPQVGGFDKTTYHGLNNSCIDFVYGGLAYAGVYNPPKEKIQFLNRTLFEKNYEGTIKVRPNADEFDKIPYQRGYENSDLNTPPDRRRHENPSCAKAFGFSWKTGVCWLSENQQHQEQQTQYAQTRSLSISDVPAPAQKLYAQTEERMRAFYQEFDIPFQEHELKNAAAALAVVAYEKRLPEVQDFELHNGKMVAFYESRGGAYKEALLDADFANNMPQQESFARMIEAEPKLELAAQQRAMEIAAYEQSQSMGRSI